MSLPVFQSVSLETIKNIRQINCRFDEISTDRETLKLTNEEGKRRGGVSSINLSSTSHLMDKDNIFGRIDDKEKIINQLLAGVLWGEVQNVQLRVIPILGMGGIGKTTLAQMVHHDLSVQSIFDVMAWVYVSPEFNIIRITNEISEFVTANPTNRFDGFSKIQEVLQKELVGKTMFLVLDDVWNVQQNEWEMLFLPLRAAKLVRVLVTSRIDAVSQAPHIVSPHRLQVLPEHECLKLLYNCAFGVEGMRGKEWSLDIGRQIIKKCGGLPLAVKCIGRVLHCNKDLYSWWEILSSELWESAELDPIFCALKVSYNHLPPKLRECLLFCSLFPKERKRAEDVGEEYLAELQMRYFIVPCTKSSFRLHNVIHDLVRSLSMDKIHTIMDEKSRHIPDKIQHLYIRRGNKICQYFRRDNRLRTLFNAALRPHGSFVDLHDISLVRVLGLIGSNVLALAHSRLKHLRYLRITEFNDKASPESICLLFHLQTLEITHCYHLRELPTNIANLVNLLYLHITHVGIEELPVMLWHVHNLQILRLKECYKLRALPSGISKLKNLEFLQLKSCKLLEEIPADTGNLINLSHLDVSYSRIRTFPSSIGLFKSGKIMLAGVPDIAKKQLTSNLVDVYLRTWFQFFIQYYFFSRCI
ncbi:hypothetical protein LUZ61_008769 [Rhynchospora tenuis]|uniref:NB-ARC domain-containing protein n=1 Tax=Rhynchospora tenuis TaxID=198213 RepID=A0AAD5ZVZ7_9POAL|nr:hypothetical protein LUZ61_008769 [Rhynchospora tenuis]